MALTLPVPPSPTKTSLKVGAVCWAIANIYFQRVKLTVGRSKSLMGRCIGVLIKGVEERKGKSKQCWMEFLPRALENHVSVCLRGPDVVVDTSTTLGCAHFSYVSIDYMRYSWRLLIVATSISLFYSSFYFTWPRSETFLEGGKIGPSEKKLIFVTRSKSHR